jgi:DNA-binding Lrp family transcriptional regulator
MREIAEAARATSGGQSMMPKKCGGFRTTSCSTSLIPGRIQILRRTHLKLSALEKNLHGDGAFDHYREKADRHRGRSQKQDTLMKPIFVQLQCSPGKTYEVADAIYQTELVSELYSTSGDYDLLMKVYIAEEQDIGKFINDHIANIPGIIRSLTTLTFRAF